MGRKLKVIPGKLPDSSGKRLRHLQRTILMRFRLSPSRHTTMEARAHQFEDAAQQQDAATLGMWVFLSTEVLFFGALLLAYGIYRLIYHAAFAEAGHHLD